MILKQVNNYSFYRNLHQFLLCNSAFAYFTAQNVRCLTTASRTTHKIKLLTATFSNNLVHLNKPLHLVVTSAKSSLPSPAPQPPRRPPLCRRHPCLPFRLSVMPTIRHIVPETSSSGHPSEETKTTRAHRPRSHKVILRSREYWRSHPCRLRDAICRRSSMRRRLPPEAASPGPAFRAPALYVRKARA